MKTLAFILFGLTFCVVPTFGQMSIITTDEKLYALEKGGKYDEAIADIDERIKAQPNNGELYLRRAKFLKLQDKIDEAIADISKGIEIEPDKPSFYIARAEYYNLKNDNEAVLKDVQTAVSLAPNKAIFLSYGDNELKRGKQYEEGIKLADFCLTHHNPNDENANQIKFNAYRVRSENKFALEKYAEALEDSITAINFISFTGDNKKDFGVGITFANLLKGAVILQTTQKYLKDDERIFDFYNQLFDALEKKTEIFVNQAIQDNARIRQMLPKNPANENLVQFYPAAMNLEKLMTDCAELYVEKGQPEKGIELFQRIVNLNLPNKFLRYSHRANFYIKLKNYQAAIDDLTLTVSGDDKVPPQHPEYILFLIKRGRLYETVNQFDKAIADYETVKTINPINENAMNEMISKARQKQMDNANQPK